MVKSLVGMRLKLFFSILAVLFVSILILSAVNFKVSSKVLKNQITEATSKSLKNVRDNFADQFIGLKEDLDGIYAQKDFIEALTQGESHTSLRQEYSSLARSFATKNIPTDKKVDAFYIYTSDHYCISHYRRADTPTYRYPTDIYNSSGNGDDYNAQKVKEYVESERSDLMLSSYYNQSRQKNVLRFVYKIYVQNRGRLVGYLVCDTDERMLTERINSYTYYDGQVVGIQPIDDRVAVLTGNPEDQQKKIVESISNKIQESKFTVNSKSVLKDLETDDDEVFVTALSRYGILMYSLYPEDMLRDTRSEMVVTILNITGFILVFAALIIWAYSNRVSGEFAEIQRNAEYKALQAQINPHFLYNTLETMSSIARRRNCAEVSELCLALSSMFRYSIGVRDSIVPLQREVEHIRNYLYVMTTRMQNDIEIEVDIKSSHMSLMMPKLILQPVVENAMKHGLSQIRGEKKLAIRTVEEGEKVHIIVEDNGTGMDSDEMNRWLNSKEKEEQKDSIGLRNIHKRLQLIFGVQYGLMVEDCMAGSRVHIVIPKSFNSCEK
ncbi:Histidine kinase [Lachnospiraceae bacterium]|nr:Histidine kinase [Lachnospiraceae bacterium]